VLTPREFALLLHLMRHPGVVQSQHDILENVWDAHFDGDPNIVEVYIGYLRRKLAATSTRIESFAASDTYSPRVDPRSCAQAGLRI
jgi:DNA-binding response OmpR family regulator